MQFDSLNDCGEQEMYSYKDLSGIFQDLEQEAKQLVDKVGWKEKNGVSHVAYPIIILMSIAPVNQKQGGCLIAFLYCPFSGYVRGWDFVPEA